MALGDNLTFTKPNFGPNPVTFFKEAQAELKKVAWPGRKELVQLTIVVILVSAGIGIYLGALDIMFTKLIELYLSKK